MSFLKKLFGKKDKPQDVKVALPWIEPSQNPWGLRILDLRPVTHEMLSTTTDRQLAENAASYFSEDGLTFADLEPAETASVPGEMTFTIDRVLLPGALFIPKVMEHKWAVYYHNNKLIFIRSWQREVWVTAETKQENNQLIVTSIRGKFLENEPEDFTRRLLKALMTTHVLGLPVPVPLPVELADEPNEAALWAFSVMGNLAEFGVFEESADFTMAKPIRSHSLLHIAVARGDLDNVRAFIKGGYDVNTLAGDGLAPLQWAIAPENTEAMKTLLLLGADPNVRSAEGATPVMNAVQSNKAVHFQVLLEAGADVNAQDGRGFTALHRAAEMGHTDMVKALLAAGADKAISAGGYTALSLAEHRGNREIIKLLHG